MRKWLIVGAVLAAPSAAWPAAPDSAQDVERGCRAVDNMADIDAAKSMEAAFCLGILSGVNDTMALWKGVSPPAPFCLPDKGITLDQSRRLFLKYLQDNPKDLNERAVLVYIRAIHETFPCTAK